ncbi:MAG: winged helix-turn-helix transcriptional regulator [Synergistaceae bacterium]|nr:winged helix-turn-helix transcriptional regulator [Synergistaceae bacterium]
MSKRIDNTECHCLKIRRSAENVINFYDEILSSSGVTVRQYSLLNQIAGNEGCNVRELSELTELDRSTLSRSLKPLINTGLVYDAKAPETRDSKLFLSDEGRKVCNEAAVLWAQAQERFEKIVGAENVKLLENLLERLQNL